MNKLTNKKTIFLDVFTLLLVLVFPLLRSQDHELFMTVLSIVAVTMFFSNISQVRFSYKSDLNAEDNWRVAMLIWAKMFIICSLLNVGVQDLYLDNAIANRSSLNVYSGRAIIGWELVIWMFRTVLFYVPTIASANVVLYAIFLLVAKLLKRFNVYKALTKLVKKFKKQAKKLIDELINFNNKVLNFMKANKSTRLVDYLATASDLSTSDKKAQLPPLFTF